MSRSQRGGTWRIPWLGLPLGALAACAVLGYSLLDSEALAPPPATEPEATAELRIETPPELPRVPDESATLRPGDTLGAVLERLGLAPDEAFQVAVVSSQYIDLRQLRAGTPWSAFRDGAGQLERLDLRLPGRGELTLARDAADWRPSWRQYQRTSRVRMVNGVLDGAFESAMLAADGSPELAYELADVLQWDLDFSRDLRVGDEFAVLFEEEQVEGEAPRPERVLAARWRHPEGRALEAYWFERGARSGYYDEEGRPLQKMFLRSPLPYTRITSRFTNRRFHPVLGRFMPHHGVDYGAPTGTPVRATASGTVVHAGWKGGGGRMIEIRHPRGYLTGYLHLSRIAAGVRPGARVSQGDVIGYVGMTGLATAPHLDYRVQHDGRWIDPLSLKALPADPIAADERASFAAVRDAMRASLDTGDPYAPPAFALARASSEPLPRATVSSKGR